MKQNRSILFLTRLYHPHIGGVEKHVAILSEELIKKGFSVTVVTERFNEKMPLSEMIDGVLVNRIPIGKNERLKKFLVWKWILFNLPLVMKQDVIHVHDVFYWILPFRAILLTKKVYITFHGYEGYPVRFLWKIQRKVAERLTNGNICVGKFMKKWYLTSPTSVIYGAVRLTKQKYEEKNQTAVFFGRLDSQTGILEYIKAYQIIKKKYPKFTLTVVGEGEFKKKIPKGVKLEKFTSNIGPYIGKNRFIFVSRYLSMLEALVEKKEIFAVYNSPIMKDYLLMSPFAKYVAVSSNGDEIAECVIKSMKEKTRDKRIDQGYQWAIKQTWDAVVSTHIKLWQ